MNGFGRSHRVGMAIVVGALALAGCSSTPERAVTLGTASPAASPAAVQSSTPVERPKGAGDPLDAKQVKSAVLAVGDMPTGWAAAENQPDSKSKTTVEPASCQKLFDDMKGDDSRKPTASAKATFSKGGALGTQLVEEVSSYPDEGQVDKLDEFAAALTKCSKLTMIEGGKRVPVTLSGLSFPNLGDQTFAMRLTMKVEGLEAVADAVFVAVGRNTVSFTTAGLQPVDGAELEKVARAGMAKVADAAKG